MTKTGFKAVILACMLLLLLAGCKKDVTAPSEAGVPSLDSQIQDIKDSALDALNGTLGESVEGEEGQTVFFPAPSGEQSFGSTISQQYASSCLLAKYRFLNKYCSFKNFWHNQSILLSWYIPYSIVLFLLFIFLIWLGIYLWGRR